ncbi:aspartate/glutamate racemase family protein [Christiangramia echinicola]|uniref:Aspartate racemase n=1 Tax=Christiangramia echinicola TaxID=279359 RepID=A0A1H1KW42_9FLAO|nr:amino acid racemase [Christiangramia echinicola]SDR66456.1 aspartate racemase [Christiangramia echinicola]
MKTLGLIGGTSWHSTVVYYKKINELVAKKIGGWENPPMIIYSLNIKLMREQNIPKIKAEYLKIARKLEVAGAEAIIICANTPHMVFEYVQPMIRIPIIHIGDAIGAEARKHNIKKLGLLGNRPTMTGTFIQDRLKKGYDIETIISDTEYIDSSHNYISSELTQGKFTDEARKFFKQQMELLKVRGVEGIILGCTELPILLDQKDFDLPLFSTTDLHIQKAVDFILEKVSTVS